MGVTHHGNTHYGNTHHGSNSSCEYFIWCQNPVSNRSSISRQAQLIDVQNFIICHSQNLSYIYRLEYYTAVRRPQSISFVPICFWQWDDDGGRVFVLSLDALRISISRFSTRSFGQTFTSWRISFFLWNCNHWLDASSKHWILSSTDGLGHD